MWDMRCGHARLPARPLCLHGDSYVFLTLDLLPCATIYLDSICATTSSSEPSASLLSIPPASIVPMYGGGTHCWSMLTVLLASTSSVAASPVNAPLQPDHPIVSGAEPLYLDQHWFATHAPSSGFTSAAPCLPRSKDGGAVEGMSVSFTLVSTIKELCGDGHTPMDTVYSGHICDGREDIAWTQLQTINAPPGPSYCKNESWTSANAAQYTGSCGVAPWVSQTHTPGINVSAVVPVWLCAPPGFQRVASGGSWVNRVPHGNQTVEGCANACRSASECKAFAVSDVEGCGLFHSKLQLPFRPQANTSTYTVHGAAPSPGPSSPTSRPIPATVPGDIITDLQRNRLVGDPYFNQTWQQPGFIASWNNGTWTYSRNFTSAAVGTRQTLLVFDSIRMGAMITLNGHALGNATNQFLRYVFPVGQLLKPAGGENVLTVTFGAELGISTGGRFSFANFGGFSPVMTTSVPTPADKRNPTRSTFGFGIVKSVYVLPVPALAIIHFAPLTFYAGGHPTTILADKNHSGFEIRARVTVWAASVTAGEFRVSLPTVSGASVSLRANVSTGESSVTLVLPAAATRSVLLWHPRNHGGQPLYNITVSFIPSSVVGTPVQATRRIGFRHVALVTVNESSTTASQAGTGTFTYFLRVNGAAVFARGASKVPVDLLEGRITGSSHRQLVESAIEANMNMLRVWGGGIWEDRALMEACDELGLLVYMDLMFTWNSVLESVVAGSSELPATVKRELEHQIQRLSHHPSAVLWTGGNEIGMSTDPGWTTHMELVLPFVASLDGSRPMVPSSGPAAVGWVSGVDALSCRPNGGKLVSSGRTAIGVYPGFAFDQDAHGPYSFMMNPFRPSPLWAWISTDVMPVGLDIQPREACSVGTCAAPHVCTEHSNCTPTSVPARTGPGHPGFFRSEFGAVSWSSFEAMRDQLPPDRWSMKSACGSTDPHACLLRNHRGDNVIQQFFGSAAAHPGTDTLGEQPFKRSLYRSMISAMLMHKTNIESWRSQNVQGLLVSTPTNCSFVFLVFSGNCTVLAVIDLETRQLFRLRAGLDVERFVGVRILGKSGIWR